MSPFPPVVGKITMFSRKRLILSLTYHDLPFCAQIMSKNHQEYQNVSKDIELYRNPGAFKNAYIPENFYYFLRVTFFRRFLHTGEVRGSSPLSPTISLFFDLGIKGTNHSLLIWSAIAAMDLSERSMIALNALSSSSGDLSLTSFPKASKRNRQ